MTAQIKHDRTASVQLPAARQELIADLLEHDGAVTVAQLERQFGVSSMTARRDLAALARAGLARRTHGGAVAPGIAAHEDSFQHRLSIAVDCKERIAAVAAALVQPHETVFVDSSSTAWYAVRALLALRTPVTLVTNAVPVIELASGANAAHVELIALGGSLRRLTRSFVGPHAVRTAQQHLADSALLSVKGITEAGVLTDPDPLEAEVKRTLIANAERPLLLADAGKLRARGMAVIAPLEQLHGAVVAGAEPPELAVLRSAGLEVHEA